MKKLSVKDAHMRSGLFLWIMAQKASPSLKDEDMFVIFTLL